MKIALVTHWISKSGGGVAAVVEQLSSALQFSSIGVNVYGLSDERWETDRSDWMGARVEAFPTIGPKSLGLSPLLRSALKTSGADLAHLHGIWMHTTSDVLNWSRSGRPFIVSPHGMLDKWAIRRSRAKKVLAKFFFEDRLLRSAVCLHALNAEEVESIRDFGLTNPVCVIPNGIMLPPVGPESSPPWKEKFGTEARVLLFLGRLHPKKNVHGLIEAFSQLKSMRKLDDWRLVIAGWDQDGYGKNLDRQVRASGLSDEVVFVGPLYGAEKHAALSNSAAFVLPSFSEGLPMAVLEAWSYGLPVAMSDACNLSEGFRCGAAFQLDTGPKLAEGLYRLLEAPPCLLAEMGERGKRMVTARYSWDAVGAQFGEVYNWALTGGCVPSCVDLYKG